MRCPICAQPLEGGELVMVCGPCHRSLGGPGSLAVGATGEFRVPPELIAAAAAGHAAAAEHADIAATAACAWCGKSEPAVKKLLGRRGTALCDECIGLAADIMDAELGPDWR